MKDKNPNPNEVYFNGAVGCLNNLGGITVKTGSIIAKEEATSCSDTAHRLRKMALEAGELREENGHYILLVDKEFKRAEFKNLCLQYLGFAPNQYKPKDLVKVSNIEFNSYVDNENVWDRIK